MSRSAAHARAGQDRASLYSEITDKIIAELEAGRVPWVQPWGTAAAKASLAMPKNAATQRRYSGINVLILWAAVIEHGFAGQSWLTFRPTAAMFAKASTAQQSSMPTASRETMWVRFSHDFRFLPVGLRAVNDIVALFELRLEVFTPRPHIQLQCPGAAVLVMHVPIGFCDCIGMQHAVRPALLEQVRRA